MTRVRNAECGVRNDSRLKTHDCRQEATCIGCGCSDGHACIHSVTGPCWWIKVDREHGIGVCSECEEKVELFETMALVMHEKTERKT